MRLVGFFLGIADAAFDDRLVNGVVLRRLFGEESKIDEESFNGSEHRMGWCGKGYLVFGRGSSSSSSICFSRMTASCVPSCCSLLAESTVAPSFFSGAKVLAATSKAMK